MTKKNIRDKIVHSQPEAREKAQLRDSLDQPDYTNDPKKQSDQKTDEKKRKVLEDNDYAGTRPVDDKIVTEKGSRGRNSK